MEPKNGEQRPTTEEEHEPLTPLGEAAMAGPSSWALVPAAASVCGGRRSREGEGVEAGVLLAGHESKGST